ncbi:hypothetical protein V8Z74_10665 [Comamonas sp. w2-DMI]
MTPTGTETAQPDTAIAVPAVIAAKVAIRKKELLGKRIFLLAVDSGRHAIQAPPARPTKQHGFS